MRYVLITKLGRVMVFNVKSCAELYQTIYGGTITLPTVGESVDQNSEVQV